MAEVDLYAPIKAFLEAQGYEVKGEIGACDIVAVRPDEDPVVVELKERLNLALVLQAVDRLRVSDSVYVAFRTGKGHSASWRSKGKQVTSLLRRLGVGLLTVSNRGSVVAVLDPKPYKPRKDVRRKGRLMAEFTARVGDPEAGGSTTRERLTSYRQDAVRCAVEIAAHGALKVSVVRDRTGVERVGPILRDNHYGWFERVKKGHYDLTDKGAAEMETWKPRVAYSPTADEPSPAKS